MEAVLIQVHQGEWSSVIHSNRCEDEQYKGDEDGWTWMYQPKMLDRYRTGWLTGTVPRGEQSVVGCGNDAHPRRWLVCPLYSE